jgi:hypothetical protein
MPRSVMVTYLWFGGQTRSGQGTRFGSYGASAGRVGFSPPGKTGAAEDAKAERVANAVRVEKNFIGID